MRYLIWTLISLIFAIFGAQNVSGTSEKSTVKQNLPERVEKLFRWPDFTKIPEEKFMKGDENRHILNAKTDSVYWIKEFFADEWLPRDCNEIERGIVLVKNEYGSTDVTHFEWIKNGYHFCVSQSCKIFTVTITPVADANIIDRNTIDGTIASALQLSAQFIRNISKVEEVGGKAEERCLNIVPQGTKNVLLAKSFDRNHIKICDDGLIRERIKELDSMSFDEKGYLFYWWGRVEWWTNGRSLGLYTLKINLTQWVASYKSGFFDDSWFEELPQQGKGGEGNLLCPAAKSPEEWQPLPGARKKGEN